MTHVCVTERLLDRLEQGQRSCSGREHRTVGWSRAAPLGLQWDLLADDIWKWGGTLNRVVVTREPKAWGGG